MLFENVGYWNSETLDISWDIINEICLIEKFDGSWPFILKINSSSLSAFYQQSENVLRMRERISGALKDYSLTKFENLFSLYEIELSMQPLMKCMYFSYQLFSLMKMADEVILYLSQIVKALLFEEGYHWVNYIILDLSELKYDISIQKWASLFFSALRDGQQSLLRKIDQFGLLSLLSPNEKLLVHIIEEHRGITTSKIARKIGKSDATVRRMLSKLRAMNLLINIGYGPKLSHVCIANAI